MKKINFIEKFIAVFGLFLSTEAVFPLFRKEGLFNANLIDLFTYDAWCVIFILSASFLVLRMRTLASTVVSNKLLIILMIFTLISIYWSSVPAVTLNHDISFLGTACFAIYLITRFSWQQLMHMTLISTAICTILSVLFIFLLPQLGTDFTYNGAWRGIFPHKNTFGRIMVLSILLWTWFISYHRKRKLLGSVFIGISFILLVKSASTTSLLLAVIVVAIFPLYRFLRLKGMISAALYMFGIPLFSYAVFWMVKNYEFMMNAMEKETTLTGRTTLWQAVWKMAMDQPYFGYGYGAFWLGKDGPSAYVWTASHWQPTFSHNGYLEIILQTGFIGLALFVITLIFNIVNAIKLINRDNGPAQMFPLQFLFFSFFYNLTESTLLVPKLIFWIFYLAITIHLNMHPVIRVPLEFKPISRDYWRRERIRI